MRRLHAGIIRTLLDLNDVLTNEYVFVSTKTQDQLVIAEANSAFDRALESSKKVFKATTSILTTAGDYPILCPAVALMPLP
jgi:hypothetical protein